MIVRVVVEVAASKPVYTASLEATVAKAVVAAVTKPVATASPEDGGGGESGGVTCGGGDGGGGNNKAGVDGVARGRRRWRKG